MKFDFKSNGNIIKEMMGGLRDIDMGEVLGDWRVTSMDRQMREAKMSPKERHEEIMEAYDFDETALSFIEKIFPPVNDLRGDTTGTESSSNTFKDGLKAIVDSSRQGTNMHKIEQRDTDRVVDSGGRSPGER